MRKYNINFIIDDEAYSRSYRAISAGQAFAKCLKKYPKAKLIKAWQEGGFLDGWGITTYAPPSTAKVEAKPAPKQEQMQLDL